MVFGLESVFRATVAQTFVQPMSRICPDFVLWSNIFQPLFRLFTDFELSSDICVTIIPFILRL